MPKNEIEMLAKHVEIQNEVLLRLLGLLSEGMPISLLLLALVFMCLLSVAWFQYKQLVVISNLPEKFKYVNENVSGIHEKISQFQESNQSVEALIKSYGEEIIESTQKLEHLIKESKNNNF